MSIGDELHAIGVVQQHVAGNACCELTRFGEAAVDDDDFYVPNVPQPQKEAVIQESPSEQQLLPHFPYNSINPFPSRKPSLKGF